MNNMALIVPSRGRPKNIERLYKALHDTDSKVDLYIGIDADDPNIEDYEKLAREDLIVVISDVRERFGPTLNRIAIELANDYDYLAWMGDDHLPITKHWDQ